MRELFASAVTLWLFLFSSVTAFAWNHTFQSGSNSDSHEVGDRYNYDPIGTAERNDFLFTAGVKWNYRRKK
ncbi:MAG: hypothetical protein ABI539_02310 [Acidobacteriota bacterium]